MNPPCIPFPGPIATALPQVLVPRLVRQSSHVILRVEIESRCTQLIGPGFDHRVQPVAMRLDRHGAVATTQRDRVFVLFDLLQRQPFGKHLLRLPEYVTNRRCCRSLVARHDPSSSPTPICRERLSPCNCVPCRAPPTCLSPIHRQSILGTTSSPPREPAMQLSENV